MKTTHWFYDEVKFVYDEGMMNGTGDMMFSPNASTTRGMIWTILARYAGQPTDGIPWYVAGQTWAKENNISDGTNPMDNITREQMVTMLYRYADSPAVSGDLSQFPDANQVSSYAKDAMIWSVTTGIITGNEKGNLNPKDNATRAETAAILMRFCENDTSAAKKRNITFHYNYGDKDTYLTDTVVEGSTIKEPKAPVRSGYRFVAWYSDPDCTKEFDFSTPITKDVTVYAKWKKISGSGGSSTPPSDIQITIQNPGYDEDMNRIVTQDQKITLTGTATSSKTISRVTVTYAGYDKPTQSAQVTGTEAWSAEIPLEIGTNAILVTATNAAGQTTTFETVVNRTNAKLEYKDSVKLADAGTYNTLKNDFVSCQMDDNNTPDDPSDDKIILLVKENALLLQQISEGKLKVDQVYMIPQNDIFVTGFSGVYQGHQAPRDTENYPDAEYEELIFTTPSMSDLFDEDVSLDFSAGVDPDDPIAFIMTADGTRVDQDKAGQVAGSSEEGPALAPMMSRSKDLIGNELYPQKGWQPQELSKRLLPTIKIDVDQYGEVTMGLDWKDVVLYDHDGVKNTEGVSTGQLKLTGKMDITDLNYTGGVEWHPNWNPFAFDVLPQQVYSKLQYDFDVSLKLFGEAEVTTKELVKQLNSGFDNKCEFWGIKVTGVDSLKTKWVIGTVGFQIATLTPIHASSISGIAAASTLNPTLVLVFFLDMDGNITLEGNITYSYESEVSKGLNIQKVGYTGSYGSPKENRSDKHYKLGFDRELDVYDTNDATYSLSVGGSAETELDFGVGVGSGIMFGGICPAMIDGELFYRAKGLAEGEFQFLPTMQTDGFAELYHGIGSKAAVSAKVIAEVCNKKPGFDVKRNFEHMFWEDTLSTSRLEGTVYEGDSSEVSKDSPVVPDATVTLKKNDTGKIWTTKTDKNGQYTFKSIPKGRYTLTVEKDGFETYTNNALDFEKKGTQDVFLTPVASQQSPVPTELTWGRDYGDEINTTGTYTEVPGMISWKTGPGQVNALIKLYKVNDQGEPEGIGQCEWGFPEDEINETGYRSVFNFIDDYSEESGTYYFTVQSIGDGENDSNSDIATSDTWTYVRPNPQLPQVQDVSWVVSEGTKHPSITWSKLTSNETNIYDYRVDIYFSKTEDGEKKVVRSLYHTPPMRTDFEDFWAYGAGYYSFNVRALSNDITTIRNGLWSEMSPVYHYTG